VYRLFRPEAPAELDVNGGAFAIDASASLSLSDCAIYGNSATQDGGAIMNQGSLSISNCDLYWNDAGRGGGALSNEQDATTTIACGSEIYANTARFGAGIRVYGNSTVGVYDGSEIYGNTASMDGGGVYNDGTFTMSGGAIYSNQAIGEAPMGVQMGGHGGGVYNRDPASTGAVDLTNVLIDGNTAAVSGGGLYLKNTSITTLDSCTIQNNTAGVAAPGIAFEMGASLTGAVTCTFGNPDQAGVQV
jgi:fibronectin-binding autotransporter adhesin